MDDSNSKIMEEKSGLENRYKSTEVKNPWEKKITKTNDLSR